MRPAPSSSPIKTAAGSSDGQRRHHSPIPCTRQAMARRFPACCASGAYPPVRPAATYRSGAKTRYLPGLYLVLTALKCGGFCGSEPSRGSGLLKGRMHDRQARFGHFRDGGDRGAWLRGQRPGAADRRRAARLADELPAALHAADGEGRIAERPPAGHHHADLACSCWRCCSTRCGASMRRAIRWRRRRRTTPCSRSPGRSCRSSSW